MNWMTSIAIFAQQFFFCEISCAVMGSALILFLLILERNKWCRYKHLQLVWIKLIIVLSLVPITAGISFFSRTDYYAGEISQTFSWWQATTDSMKIGYSLLFIAWCSGLGISMLIRFYQYYHLKCILAGNIGIENQYESIVKQYQEKCPSKKILFYQNDLLENPITIGIVCPKIILPVRNYSEQELHIILQHEITHIQRNDLLWKQIGLIVSLIHWWNPLFYLLLRKLILWEEIECDAQTCANNIYFTKKEYGTYLAGVKTNEKSILFSSAWCDSKKDLFRRVEILVRGNKGSRGIAVVSCMVLTIMSVVPAYAASEGIMEVNEAWTREGENATRVEAVDYAALEQSMHVSDEPDIIEIEVESEEEISLHAITVTLDQTINANTRMLYRQQAMEEGDVVMVTANCDDSSVTYRVGLKDGNGDMVYKQGSGSINHIFTIPSDGNYKVYVENRSSKTMQVTGYANYPN